MEKRFIPFIFLSFFIISCDLDIYTGYEYSAQELTNTSSITGQITHFYNSDSVQNALVRFGNQETLTDRKGNYYINYLLSEDELRNKPTSIYVYKENYYPISYETLLSPLENTYNFTLRYAAPIIMDTRRRPVDSLLICQAIVKDYQGILSLESLQVTYYYLDDYVGQVVDSLKINIPMVHMPDKDKGYFQLIVDDPASTVGSDSSEFVNSKLSGIEGISIVHPTQFLAVYYYIEAIDEEGYRHRVFHTTNPIYPDALLFDPNEY